MRSRSVPFSLGGEMAVYGLLSAYEFGQICSPYDWLALVILDFSLTHR